MLSEQPINILLVDDRPENLLALEALLQPLGYHLIKARSGQEALRCVLQYDFAVICSMCRCPISMGLRPPSLFVGAIGRAYANYLLDSGEHQRAPYRQGLSCRRSRLPAQAVLARNLLSKVAIFVELYAKTAEVRQQARSSGDGQHTGA